jgi:hypothetical protein
VDQVKTTVDPTLVGRIQQPLAEEPFGFPGEIMKTSALTVTGRAEQVPPGADFDRWAALLAGRHPYLRAFIGRPATALFVVQDMRYVYVTRFQEVREWMPGQRG